MWRAFWGQIRWQMTACYLLIGGVSVLLVAAFAAAAINMIILRSASAAVERQLELMVQNAAIRVEGIADRIEGLLARGIPPTPPPGAPRTGQFGPSGIVTRTSCASQVFPPNAVMELPSWIDTDEFAGLVWDNGVVEVAAYRRQVREGCTIEVLFRSPVDERTAALITRASGMEVLPPPVFTPRPPGQPKKRFSKTQVVLGQLSTTPGLVPVMMTTRQWNSGAMLDRFVFMVRPNYDTIMRQLGQFGQRQAIWIWILRLIGIVFLIVEAIALWLAIHLTRRIIAAINLLSLAAAEVGAGNLDHRIPVRRDDQLARLSRSFNDMTESIQRLLDERTERLKLEQEIVLARQVQESLFPARLPNVDGIRLAARCLPARNISGDFYDVIEIGPDKIALLCADVSGKGVSAALLAASLQAAIRSSTFNGASSMEPSALLGHTNAEICRRIPDNRFITAFLAVYEPGTRRLRAVNAGHCPALLQLPDGSRAESLQTGGLPIGMFCSSQYEQQEQTLQPGSTLIAYTDGLVETENAKGEEFGEQQLLDLCQAHSNSEPEDLAEKILKAHTAWSAGAPLLDDVTLLIMRVA
jgi:serine phosphatase RsbU (regulator of sigma subunit)